jgi:hypothetical protein
MAPLKSSEIKKTKHMNDCCDKITGKCIRNSDKKPFDLTDRKYSKKECTTKAIKGFTMRASCAPFKDCKK